MNSASQTKFPSFKFGDIPQGAMTFFTSYLKGTVLDLGCGSGSIGKTYNMPVYGIDLDWSSLYTAVKHEAVICYKLGQTNLPFADNSFDSAIAKDIIEHLDEPWALVFELRRVIKPNGLVIATSPMAKPSVVWNDYTHIRGFTKGAFRSLFQHCGFEVLDIFPTGLYQISTRLHISRFLPQILKLPFVDLITGSWFIIARNRKGEPG